MLSNLGHVVVIGMSENRIELVDFIAKFGGTPIWAETSKSLKVMTRSQVFTKKVSASQFKITSSASNSRYVGKFVKLSKSTNARPAFALDMLDMDIQGQPRRIAEVEFANNVASITVYRNKIQCAEEMNAIHNVWSKICADTNTYGDKITNDGLRPWLHDVIDDLGGFSYVAGHGAFFVPQCTAKWNDCGAVLMEVRQKVLDLNPRNCVTVVPIADDPTQREDIARNAFDHYSRSMTAMLSEIESLRQRFDEEDAVVRSTTILARMEALAGMRNRILEYKSLVDMSTDMLTDQYMETYEWLEAACK
jgi:hypothetical protein